MWCLVGAKKRGLVFLWESHNNGTLFTFISSLFQCLFSSFLVLIFKFIFLLFFLVLSLSPPFFLSVSSLSSLLCSYQFEAKLKTQGFLFFLLVNLLIIHFIFIFHILVRDWRSVALLLSHWRWWYQGHQHPAKELSQN